MSLEIADRGAEMRLLGGEGNRRNRRAYPREAIGETARRGNSHEEPTWS